MIRREPQLSAGASPDSSPNSAAARAGLGPGLGHSNRPATSSRDAARHSALRPESALLEDAGAMHPQLPRTSATPPRPKNAFVQGFMWGLGFWFATLFVVAMSIPLAWFGYQELLRPR